MQIPDDMSRFVTSPGPYLFYTNSHGTSKVLANKSAPKNIDCLLPDDAVIVINNFTFVASLKKGRRDPREYRLVDDLNKSDNDDLWWVEDYYSFVDFVSDYTENPVGRATRTCKKK